MAKAKTGIAAPKMGKGALSDHSTPGAAPMKTMVPKKSIKPKVATTVNPMGSPATAGIKLKATPGKGGGGGVMKPGSATPSNQANKVTAKPPGLGSFGKVLGA